MSNFPPCFSFHSHRTTKPPTQLHVVERRIKSSYVPHEDPKVFVPIEPINTFYVFDDKTSTVTATKLSLDTGSEHLLLLDLAIHLTKEEVVAIEVTDTTNQQVLGYFPSKYDWVSNRGTRLGKGTHRIDFNNLLIPPNSSIAFTFKTPLVLKGNKQVAWTYDGQRGQFRTVITDEALLEGDTPINHRGIYRQIDVVTEDQDALHMASFDTLYCKPSKDIVLTLPEVISGSEVILEADRVRTGYTWMIGNHSRQTVTLKPTKGKVINAQEVEQFIVQSQRWIQIAAFLDNGECKFIVINKGTY